VDTVALAGDDDGGNRWRREAHVGPRPLEVPRERGLGREGYRVDRLGVEEIEEAASLCLVLAKIRLSGTEGSGTEIVGHGPSFGARNRFLTP
jgi:hypothetical protein